MEEAGDDFFLISYATPEGWRCAVEVHRFLVSHTDGVLWCSLNSAGGRTCRRLCARAASCPSFLVRTEGPSSVSSNKQAGSARPS